MKLDYIANQSTPEGLDEVQRMLLAYKLGQHLALSGPPGVGKTELVENFSRIVKVDIKDTQITCDSYMTEGPLVGFPELEGSNGSSVTVWKNGVATKAAAENRIFYGDEFDLLPGSVQKRLNSLFDDRRFIVRRDGTPIEAGDKFIGIISYNPSDKLSRRELEQAVADRFVHIPFGYSPKELEAEIGLGNKDLSGLTLEERAVLVGENIRFLHRDGKIWKDIFTGDKIVHADEAISYDAFTRQDGQEFVAPSKLSRKDIAYRLADLFDSVRTFSEHGTTKLPDEIKQYLADIGEQSNVPLHKPSAGRILKAAVKQYDKLTELGMKPEYAQSYAARVCVDQICYGQFGQRPLNKGTVRDAVTSMAQFYGLIGKPRQRTDFGG